MMSNFSYYESEDTNKSIDLLDSILNGSTEYAIIATDLSDQIIVWNKGAEDIYGYSSQEIIGKLTLMDLHRKDALQNDMLFIVDNAFHSDIREYRLTALRKDSLNIPVSVTVTPRINKKNETIGYLIISRDITNTKLQEQFRDILLEVAYLINSAKTTEAMCTSVIDLISRFMDIPVIYLCLLNKTNNNLCVNYQTGLCEKHCSHSCDFSIDEALIPSNESNCYETFSQLTITSGKLSTHAIASFISDKKLVEADYSVINIPLTSDVALLGILHIIVPKNRKEFLLTESQVLSLLANEISTGIQQKLLEEENKQYSNNLEIMVKERTEQLRQKDAQLVQSGKLATLGEMATGIAHEINQPLGGITLMAQGLIMAKQRGKLTDEILSEKLGSIVDQTERIDKIITHLRSFSRQSGESTQEVNLLNPLFDVFKLIGEQIKNRNISLEFNLKENPPPIMADHNRLEQVFLNILGNARDALDEFELKLTKMRKEGILPTVLNNWYKRIIIRCFRQDNQIILEFIDNAGGIPQAIVSKIFEPFYTTKEVGKGTGLGLSISYGIVKEFGGSIEVISEEMKGSTFIVRFPIVKK